MIDHTLNKAVAGNYAFLIKRLDALDPTVRWQVSVKPYKSQRSNAQNARYWAFLTAFGDYLGYTRDEMHDLCKYKFLSVVVGINNEFLTKLKSTPKTNTKEFAEYCEACEAWAASLGFVWGGE
jgi:hypothetical protein